MATERIEIIVTESGTDVVVKKIDTIGSSSKSSASSVDLLQSAIAGLGASATIAGISELLDTYQTAANRLLFVSQSQQEATATMQILQQQADSTRQSFESTVDLYARVALATQNMGISHADAARVVKTLQEAITLSGASTREANSALVQFTQGLAAGTLRGRELRSLMQQIPAVADIMAEKLGVTRGALRQLGTEGKISSEQMIQALLGASDRIDGAFGKSIPTIGQSFTVLQNHALEFFGSIEQKYGIISKVDDALKFLGDNMDTIGRVVIAGVLVVGVFLLIDAIAFLTAAILANPLGQLLLALDLLIVAIVAGAALLVTFSDKIKLTGDGFATLADLGNACFIVLKASFKQFYAEFMAALTALTPLFRQVFGNDFAFSIKGLLEVSAKVIDGVIGAFTGCSHAISAAFQDFPRTLELIFDAALNSALSAIQDFVNSAIFILNYISNTGVGKKLGLGIISDISITKIQGSIAAQDAGKTIAKAFKDGFDGQHSAQDILKDLLILTDSVAKQRIAKEQKAKQDTKTGTGQFTQPGSVDPDKKDIADVAVQGVIDKLKEQAQALQAVNIEQRVENDLIKIKQQLTTKGVQINDVQKQEITDQLRKNEILKEQSQILQAVAGAAEKNAIQQDFLNQKITEGGKFVEQYKAKLNDLKITQLESSRELGAGFQAGFLQVQNTISDFSKQSSALVVNTFNGMEDALVKFVTTGKINFSDLVNSILASLTKILLNKAIVGVLDSIGGGGGSLGGDLGSALGGAVSGSRALGGAVDPGKSYLVGEHGAEVFSPGQSGQVAANGAGSAPPDVHVHVVNVSDPNEISSALNQPGNQQIIVNAIRRNPGATKQALGI